MKPHLRAAVPAFVLFIGVLAVGVPDAGASGSATLFVNQATGHDASNSCLVKARPCATIGHAVTLAASGSTISVAAGTYAEQVVITQPVSIVGAGASLTIIKPPSLSSADTDTDSNQPQYAVVDINPNATGSSNLTSVNLSRLTVNGSAAMSQFTGCGEGFDGIYYHDASGSLTQVDVTGVALVTGLFGCQQGQGIYVASDAGQTNPSHTGGLSTVSMNQIKVTNFDKNGISCDDPGTNCSISNSTTTGIGPTPLTAQNGIQAFGAASATLTRDSVSGDSYTGGGVGNSASGILILNTNTVSARLNQVSDNDVNIYAGWVPSFGLLPTAGEGSWLFKSNTVVGATDNVPGGEAEYGDGIQIDSATGPVTLVDNLISANAENGIALYGARNVTASTNTTSSNKQDGIYVGNGGSVPGPSTGNTVISNHVWTNVNDGILADTASSGNSFTGNTLQQNSHFNAQDLGSTNTWSRNNCSGPTGGSPTSTC